MSLTQERNALDESKEDPGANSRKHVIGAVVGLIGFSVLLLIPTELTGPQQRLTAVLFLAIVFWVTETLPLAATSLLAVGLAAIMGIAAAPEGGPAAPVVFSSFSSSVVFLLIGGFLFAKAIHVHGLDQRFALTVLSIPGVAKSSFRVICAFGAISLTISAFVSNSATAAMMLPIGLGLVTTLNPIMGVADSDNPDRPNRSRFSVALMLMIAYSAAVGGLLTPIGSPANLVGIASIEKLSGERIGFLQWTAATAPIVATMFVILCVVIIALNRPEKNKLPDVQYLRDQRAALGPMSRGEKSTLFAFSLVCVAWVTPSIVVLSAGASSAVATAVDNHTDDGATAIIMATLLFLLPGTRPGSRALTWAEAVRIEWGVILLIGAGVALGGLLSSTGLAELTGQSLRDQLGDPSLFVVTLVAVALAIALSELTSNTVAVAIVVPIVLPIAVAADVNPIIPAIAAVFGGSFGFMLPISQPPNAIVYGSGMVPIGRMLRTGVIFDVVGCLLITLGILVWVPVLNIT